MLVRYQVIEGGAVTLDAIQPARTAYAGLHDLLRFHNIQYDPTRFKEHGGWVQFNHQDKIYRTMSARNFG